MNFGGFASGFSDGVNMGTRLNGLIQEDRKQDIRKQGVEQAKSARAAEIDNLVSKGRVELAAANGIEGPPNAEGVMPGQSPAASGFEFNIGGKKYKDEGEARTAAGQQVGSEEDFFAKKAVPFFQQKFAESGDIDTAQKWGEWAEKRESKEYAKTWMNARTAMQDGDFETAAGHFSKLQDKFQDGVTQQGKPEVMKNEQGDITGFKINLKNDATGKEYQQVVTPELMMNKGLAMLSPVEAFKLEHAQTARAAQARAEIAAKDNDRKLDHDNRMTEKKLDSQLRNSEIGDAEKKGRYLASLGFTPAQIKDGMAGSGVGQAPHPATIALQAYNKLAADAYTKYKDTDGTMKRFTNLSSEGQGKLLQTAGEAVRYGAAGKSGPVHGLPDLQNPQSGTAFLDQSTGEVVYR